MTLAEVEKSLRRGAMVFGCVMLLLAVVSGMQLLYWPNPTYGWTDLVVGFLWGAGLHAVAGQSLQGLQGLAQQFR